MSEPGPRLQAALALCDPARRRLVDVGCEGAALAASWRARGGWYLASEVTPALARQAAIASPRHTLCADGLDGLALSDDCQVLIAGIGEAGIAALLARWPQWPTWRGRLVCCPSAPAGSLRPWLQAAGWGPCADDLVTVAGRYYQVSAFAHGQPWPASKSACLLGAAVADGQHPLAAAWKADLLHRHRRMPADAKGERAALVAAARATA